MRAWGESMRAGAEFCFDFAKLMSWRDSISPGSRCERCPRSSGRPRPTTWPGCCPFSSLTFAYVLPSRPGGGAAGVGQTQPGNQQRPHLPGGQSAGSVGPGGAGLRRPPVGGGGG
eukprot:6782885-Pyramimonas_sp.AAC.1